MRNRRGLLLVVAVAAFAGGLWLSTASGDSTSSTLGPDLGVSLELPSGWIGRIYDIDRGAGPPLAALQAGSFASASDPDILKDDDVATRASEAMGSGDVLILLWETLRGGGFDYEPLTGSPRIGQTDLGTALEGFPSTHAVARRFFTTRNRFFDLMVEFGTVTPGPLEIQRVNRVLRTLVVDRDLVAASSPTPGAGAKGKGVGVDRVLRLPAGRVQRSFRFDLRATYADHVRLVVPHSAAVSAVARSADGLIRIGASTRPRRDQCRPLGALDLCDQPQEWCPLTDDRWRVVVRKWSTKPARIRVQFIFVRERR